MDQEYHTLRVKKHESCSSRFRFLFFSGSATMAPTEVKEMLGARIAALRRHIIVRADIDMDKDD